MWIGWPGIPSDELTEHEKHLITDELSKYNCAPIFLSQKQLDEFYNGYSNSILWPLLHNLRFHTGSNYEQWWKTYRSVNNLFAESIISLSRSDSTIWVHDYHLLLLPELLRHERSTGHVGLFLHVPFTDFKTLKKLPDAKKLLRGMLGADLIGFHTAGYVTNFLDACMRFGLGSVSLDQVTLDNRIIRVTDFPMGIDYEKYAEAGKTPIVKQAVKKFKRRYRGYKVIAAVDRLDPSKGLIERLQAYREFLEQTPKLYGKVVFAMVAAPSRTDIVAYQKLKQRVDELVAEINATFGSVKWKPVDYIEGLPFEEVTALFRVADVAFITPLRDGMNLVAKEFVASKRNNGVLILSETAGAAQELRDALLVDPKKPATVVEALQKAFSMPKRELRQRLKSMQYQLSNNTVHHWANNFIKALNQPLVGAELRRTMSLKRVRLSLLTDYRAAKDRLLLLDYDGSLVPFVEDYEAAKPSESLINLLMKLCSDPVNSLVIISGRSQANMEEWFSELPCSLIAEHGAYIRKVGQKSWRAMSHSETAWKKLARPIFETYAAITPRARVEEKGHSLVWHYRQSPAYYSQKSAVIIKRLLKPVIKTYGLEIFNGNKILEIKDPRINKGEAIMPWLKKNPDFIMAIGDDYTDENMFNILPPHAYTIKVGRGRTIARFRTPSSKDIVQLLKRFTG
jgi:trehalose 6-phosphate synthase/phosphatase